LTTDPRDVLIKTASGFIFERKALFTRLLVEAIAGTWMLMISLY